MTAPRRPQLELGLPPLPVRAPVTTDSGQASAVAAPAVPAVPAVKTSRSERIDLLTEVVGSIAPGLPLPLPTPSPIGASVPAAPPFAEGSGPTASLPVPGVRTDAGVIVVDVETTGTDKRRDQVIELCIQFGLGDGATARTWRFKPSVAIAPGAQAVHGISEADLVDCPAFAAAATEVMRVLTEANVIVGYNLSFDIDMLQAEFERAGLPLLEVQHKLIVDPFRLWQQCEPRSLQHAHQRFVGDAFASAHSAAADVAATGRVLEGMLRAFGLGDRDWTGIATICEPAGKAPWVGPSRHLQWTPEGAVAIGFGKHAGTIVHEMARGADAGYLRWMANQDFPAHVVEVCRAAMAKPGDAFLAWARERFPPPPAK